jgi:hypothetical protein
MFKQINKVGATSAPFSSLRLKQLTPWKGEQNHDRFKQKTEETLEKDIVNQQIGTEFRE